MHLNDIILENSLWNLLIRFFLNLFVLYILIGVIYYKYSKKVEMVFSNILIGIMIFLICSILESIELHIGMALGLFGIFSIIRFRTTTYSVKDITYIFIVIGISIINSQAHIPPPILGAALINISVVLITYLLELYLKNKLLNKFLIIYKKPEMLKPDLNKELLKDLSRQTGQNIEKVKIIKLNIDKGNAQVEVYFKDKRNVQSNNSKKQL
jgi:hypothetical protein